MFPLIAICMALVGHLAMAVPLESPSDLAPSLSVPLESPSSDLAPSLPVPLGSPSSDLAPPFPVPLESSSDLAPFLTVPLESPSSVLAPSLTVPLEIPSSDFAPSLTMPLESPSVELTPSLVMPLGSPVPDPFSAVTLHLESPSSDLAKYFDSRIVGGSNAPPGVAPHMVALVVGFDLSIKFFTCGASIITPRHVASAAHCISVDWNGNLMESFHGIAGTQTWNHGGIVVKFKGVSIHPQYDFISIKNDIAVLITSEKLEFNKKIHPICLDSGWVGGGVSCIVYGWGTQALWGGIPDILQMLQVKTICPKKCGNMIKDVSTGWGSVPPMDSKLEICTFHSPGHGMCHGDSGSALISRKTGCLAGIVSWGFPCAVGAPDVFVRIQAYLRYIKEVIRNLH